MKLFSLHEDLRLSIDALTQTGFRSWSQIGHLLDQVEKTSFWQGQAASFSEWLRTFAPTLGLGEASLWRYLASARYYEKLQQTLYGRGVSYPRLEDLPSNVSPENLELLAKLARVAPDEVLQSIAVRVVNGAITRAEMRRTWEAYRPALAGRTARGTGVEVPTVDPDDPKQFDSVIEAQVFTALTLTDPAWIGINSPQIYEVLHRIGPEFARSEPEQFEFDAVVITRATKSDSLEFHGIEIRGSHVLNQNLGRLLQIKTPYCHYLWLARDARSHGIDDYDLPADVGLLVAQGNAIRVLRQAQRSSGERTGELAKGLLLQKLRG